MKKVKTKKPVKPVKPVAIPPEKALAKTSKAITKSSSGVDGLIATAIQNKTGVEQLKELMQMKYDHEAREAKKVFHQKFSELQEALPVIKKLHQVNTKTDKKMYRYAKLPDIQKQVNPVIFSHGFSYHWSESFERDKYVRIFFTLTGYGHSESSFIDIPIQAPNDYVNSVQQAGSSNTYGKRYSMCNLLGIVAEDDDDNQSGKQKPPAEKQPEGKAKYTLPEGITPESLCKFGKFEKNPTKYKDIGLDNLLMLRDMVKNPKELYPIISSIIRGRIKDIVAKIPGAEYNFESFDGMSVEGKVAELRKALKMAKGGK